MKPRVTYGFPEKLRPAKKIDLEIRELADDKPCITAQDVRQAGQYRG
jgi:hypothetical protein